MKRTRTFARMEFLWWLELKAEEGEHDMLLNIKMEQQLNGISGY